MKFYYFNWKIKAVSLSSSLKSIWGQDGRQALVRWPGVTSHDGGSHSQVESLEEATFKMISTVVIILLTFRKIL